MKKKFVFAWLLALLFNLNIQAQSPKKYQSLLWEITGNGLTQPSYLYGTMHVSERLAFHLSDTFFVALKKCDVVALESDPTTWLPEMVNGDEYSRMMRGYNRYNNTFFEKHFVPGEFDKGDVRQMLSADPSLINGMMYRMSFGGANYEEDTYLDMFIFQAGNKLGKKVTNLEDLKKSREMVEKAYKREKGEKYNYSDYDYDEELMKGKSLTEMIEDAYRKGDLDMLDSLSNLRNPTKNFRKWMLDERNKVMVHGMDSIMKKNTLFTAVGAAHLPGKMGIIEMLREMGYTVRPVKYTATRNAIKTKEKIEKMRLPIPFSPQSVEDGAINFQATGKMYPLPFFKQDAKIYLGLDMINGSYHIITRLRSGILMEGKTPEYFMKQLDSMLFEDLPGKILFKKQLKSPEGYPIIETAVRTRNADVMKYRIYVTPFEIIVFSLGGRGEMALEKESNKFFENISFQKMKSGWSEMDANGFKVNLPEARMTYTGGTATPTMGHSIEAYDPADETYYMVKSGFYNDLNFIESDTFELNYLCNSLYRDKEDYTLVSKEKGTYQNYPTQTSVFKDKNGKYSQVKFYIQKDRYFMQAAFGKSEKGNPAFFNSFQITQVDDTCKYKEFYDSTLFFHMNLPVTLHEQTEENNYGYSIYDYGYDDEDEKEVDRSHESQRESRTFTHPLTGEVVEINYERLARYEKLQPIDSIVKYLDFYSWDSEEMKHSPVKKTQNGNRWEISYNLLDTASVRVIKVRTIYNNGTKYQLRFYTDTVSKPSKFESEVFTSFRPADTVIGLDAFSDKRDLFFEHLAGDSTKHAQALESMHHITFKDEDAPKLIAEVKKCKHSAESSGTRSSLIREIGRLKHKEVMPFLLKTYADAGDTTYLQNASLAGMLSQKTRESYQSFLSSITTNTPLTENAYDVRTIFWQAHDSLELTATLFPKLLELTQFDEYKEPVYGLFLQLLDSNLIKKETIGEKKNLVLREANEELKRRLSDKTAEDEEANDYGSNYGSKRKKNPFDMDELTPDMRRKLKQELDKMGMTLGEAMEMYGGGYDDDDYDSGDKMAFSERLLLHYRSEPQVKQFFEKIEKSGNKELQLSLNLLYLEKDIPVADTIWKRYSADPEIRTFIYTSLKEKKKENLFDPAYYNQQSFVESEIVQRENINIKKDSLTFLEKHFVVNANDTGYLYVYKYKTRYNDNWQLLYCGYQPEDTSKVNDGYQFIRTDYLGNRKQNKIDKEIRKFLQELSYEGHPRINPSSRYERDYYYEEY